METIWMELLKQSPIIAALLGFTWALLRIVERVLGHYQEMLSDILGRMLTQLDKLEERTRRCAKINEKDC